MKNNLSVKARLRRINVHMTNTTPEGVYPDIFKLIRWMDMYTIVCHVRTPHPSNKSGVRLFRRYLRTSSRIGHLNWHKKLDNKHGEDNPIWFQSWWVPVHLLEATLLDDYTDPDILEQIEPGSIE